MTHHEAAQPVDANGNDADVVCGTSGRTIRHSDRAKEPTAIGQPGKRIKTTLPRNSQRWFEVDRTRPHIARRGDISLRRTVPCGSHGSPPPQKSWCAGCVARFLEQHARRQVASSHTCCLLGSASLSLAVKPPSANGET